jgi:hypothetical protein
MRPYRPSWDMSTIPDPALRSEVGRRSQLQRRTRAGGRPPTPTPCLRCGALQASATAARGHCTQRRPAP